MLVKSPTASTHLDETEQPAHSESDQSESVRAAAHELRSPISSLLAFTRVLEKRVREGAYDSVESFVELSQAIRRNAEQVSLLVDDLLDASFANSGEFSMQKNVVDLSALVGATIEDIRPHTDLRDQTVLVDVTADLTVVGDMARLCQALRNVILNSSKYSPDGNGIKISAAREKDFVRIDVIDEGMGISRRDLGHLFERSFRGSSAVQRGVPGSGFGLYLTKRIIDQHGGSIGVKSRVGKGTTVTLRLLAIDQSDLANGH